MTKILTNETKEDEVLEIAGSPQIQGQKGYLDSSGHLFSRNSKSIGPFDLITDTVNLIEKLTFSLIPPVVDTRRIDIEQYYDGSAFLVLPTVDYTSTIKIGDSAKRFTTISLDAADEITLRATGAVTNTYLLIEPTRASFFTNTANTFKLRFPNLGSDPVSAVVGDVTVVAGILKICTSVGPVVWTTVGTQV